MHQLDAHGKNGVRRRPEAQPKSPPRPILAVDHAFNTHHDRYSRWDTEKPAPNFALYPTALEELEAEFMKQTIEIRMLRDKEEDEENYRHRERLGELRESYGKKLEGIRSMHAKQWEEFLRMESQRRVLAYQAQQMPVYAAYGGGGQAADGWGGGMYAAMSPQDAYAELQQRREDLARAAAAYGRY